MMTLWLCLLTLTCLIWMARLDPKRRRVQRLPKIRQRPWLRRSISGLCLLPGLTLIFLGAWPSFLIWLGVSTLSGWLIAWISAKPLRL